MQSLGTQTLKNAGPMNRHLAHIGKNDLVRAACTDRMVSGQTITGSQKVEGCSIKVQNTTVTGNAALTLEALEEVTIQGGFEVSNGATLEIKVSR